MTIIFLKSNAKTFNLILDSISNTPVLRQNTSIQKNLYLTSKGRLSVTTPEKLTYLLPVFVGSMKTFPIISDSFN